jgi:hypothetical protein
VSLMIAVNFAYSYGYSVMSEGVALMYGAVDCLSNERKHLILTCVEYLSCLRRAEVSGQPQAIAVALDRHAYLESVGTDCVGRVVFHLPKVYYRSVSVNSAVVSRQCLNQLRTNRRPNLDQCPTVELDFPLPLPNASYLDNGQ